MDNNKLSKMLNNISSNIPINAQLNDFEVNKIIQESENNPKKKRKIYKPVLAFAMAVCIVIIFAIGIYKNSQPVSFSVVATEDSSNGISPISAFKIDASKKTSLDYVKQNFKIEPSVDYTVTQTSNKEFEIVPTNELEANTIYNIQYTKEDGSVYKWSFQTTNTFRVTETYPKDRSTDIPINTGIEINFSYKPKDIEKYFEITPNVQGTFEYKYNKVTFKPSEALQPQTLYTITIKQGLGSDETDKILDKDYTTGFVTSSNGNEKLIDIDDLNSFTTNNISGIPYTSRMNLSENEKINVTLYSYKTEEDFESSMEYVSTIPEWAQYLSQTTINVDLSKLNKITSYDTYSSENNYKIKLPTDLNQGYYMAEIEIGSQKFYTNIQINNTIAIVNCYGKNANIWVNDGKTNKSVSDATILYNDKEVGKTDKNGSYIISNLDLNKTGKDRLQIKEEGNPTLYLYGYFYNENFDINNDVVSYIYTDKDLYREGETINVWGFAKSRNNTPINSITISITDYDNNVMEERDVTLDELNCFNTTFKLDGYTEGGYLINIKSGGKTLYSRNVIVKKYTNKNYIIDTTQDKKIVYAGEKVNIEIQAKMFDGTIASDLSLHYKCDTLGKEGDVKTDKNGIANIQIDTSSSDPNNVIGTGVEIYNVNLDSESETAYVNFSILPGKENLQVTNSEYKDNKINFTVKTYMFDKDKDDLVGKATNRTVTLFVNKYTNEKVVTGTYYDEITKTMQETYNTVERFDGTTTYTVQTENGSGELSIDNPFVKGESSYLRISAQMMDENNNSVQRNDSCWYSSDFMSNYMNQSDYFMEMGNQSSSYHVGDNINLNIKTPNDNSIRTMYLIDTVDGMETIFNDGPKYSIKFNEKYMPNVYVYAYVFDGEKYSYAGTLYCSIDEKDISMNVELKTDKTEYKPGDTVKLDISAKDSKGKGVKSEVNISVVDEAYFAGDAEDLNLNILRAVENRDMYYVMTFNSHENNGFQQGGGGGGGPERSNFVDTATVKTIVTDESGNGHIEFTLPDNLTTWRITSNSVTNDVEIAEQTDKIVASLPFFVQTNLKDEYLKDDEPQISIRANGNLDTSDNVNYNIILQGPDSVSNQSTLSGQFKDFVSFSTGKLKSGTYTLKIEGTMGEYDDTIIKKFVVSDTLLTTKQNEKINISNNQKINVNKGIGKLYLYNEKTAKVYETLLELKNMNTVRNDQIIVNTMANELISKLSNDEIKDESNAKVFSDPISQVDNSDISLMLTVKTLSAGYKHLNTENIKSYLYDQIQSDNTDSRSKLIAYWGLASLKEPVLLDLKEMRGDLKSENTYEKIILGLAFADIGDYDSATQIYNEVKSSVKKDTLDQYGLLTLLAIKLNLSDKDAMYDYTISNETDIEISNFLKIFYAENLILKNTEKASVKYSINGEDKEVNLDNGKISVISIKNSDEFVIKGVSGKVTASLEQSKEINKSVDNKTNITKNYSVNGTQTNDFKVGDIVTVRIDIDYNQNIKKGVYTVEDILPNGMSYLYSDMNINDNSAVTNPINISGQKLTFMIYYDGVTKPYITYKTRISGIGNYMSDGTILKDENNNVVCYSTQNAISIK